MIQRIQTLYSILALLFLLIPIFFTNSTQAFDGHQDTLLVILSTAKLFFALLTLVCLCLSIILFKSIDKQKKAAFLAQLFLLLLLICLLCFYLSSSFRSTYAMPDTVAFPLLICIAFIFSVLSHRAIKKDHELLKSVDRIR